MSYNFEELQKQIELKEQESATAKQNEMLEKAKKLGIDTEKFKTEVKKDSGSEKKSSESSSTQEEKEKNSFDLDKFGQVLAKALAGVGKGDDKQENTEPPKEFGALQ